jgi:hypothetical protein
MMYKLKVKFLKTTYGSKLWRKWKVWRGENVGSYNRLPEFIKNYVFPGASFADIGCMWGVNGEYAFFAEECGATLVKGVDVFGPTPEFELKKKERNSKVEFVLGDVGNSNTLARIGIVDIVFCAGVLYHHPSPFDLLVALRKICNKTLILRTSAIPEIDGLPNAAIYYPMLRPGDRQLWNLKSLGLMKQVGITDGFEPNQGYGNWFWGLTPSCIKSLLETAGFEVEYNFKEPFAQTYICKPVAIPFEHHLPNEQEAQEMANVISSKGIAQPA